MESEDPQQTTEQREARCIGCNTTIRQSELDPLPDGLPGKEKTRFDGRCPNCGLMIWFERVDRSDARKFAERLAEVCP